LEEEKAAITAAKARAEESILRTETEARQRQLEEEKAAITAAKARAEEPFLRAEAGARQQQLEEEKAEKTAAKARSEEYLAEAEARKNPKEERGAPTKSARAEETRLKVETEARQMQSKGEQVTSAKAEGVHVSARKEDAVILISSDEFFSAAVKIQCMVRWKASARVAVVRREDMRISWVVEKESAEEQAAAAKTIQRHARGMQQRCSQLQQHHGQFHVNNGLADSSDGLFYHRYVFNESCTSFVVVDTSAGACALSPPRACSPPDSSLILGTEDKGRVNGFSRVCTAFPSRRLDNTCGNNADNNDAAALTSTQQERESVHSPCCRRNLDLTLQRAIFFAMTAAAAQAFSTAEVEVASGGEIQ